MDRLLPEAAERVAAPEVRAADEEERVTPVPETLPAEAGRATLLAEVREVRVAAARVVAPEVRVAAARVEDPLLVEALREAVAELLRLERPPRASVRRPCVRLLVPK